MLRILIVDDESTTRKGMQACIDWQKHDFKIIGEAENGADALEIAKKLKPDIILSDICMPIMNGIELVENLRQILPECKFVIMSGYDEFSYAKSLMSFKVAHYLLKPVDEEELLGVLNKLAKEIFDEELKKADLEITHQMIHESFPQIKSKFMKNVLHHSFKDDDEMQQWADVLNIHIDAKNHKFSSIIIALDQVSSSVGSLNVKDKEKNNVNIVNAVEKIFLQFGTGILCYYDFDYFTGLLCMDSSEIEDFDIVRHEIKSVLKSVLPQKAFIGISNPIKHISNISESYHEAITQINDQQHRGRSAIIKMVLKYMEDYYDSEINLSTAAKEVYVTPNYLSKIFKEEMDINFVDWLNCFRIEKAKELLVTTNLKVYEIAEKVGYKNYKYFSTIFKKVSGVSPRNYNK